VALLARIQRKRDKVRAADELRVLIATDVLSEGQNLQDCAIIVNYDLPWAIIRLIQRAGRVDRIGQQSDKILCYSFVPADGVERLIKLRARVRQRLVENKEVVGSDETFFDDDKDDELIRDLYTERTASSMTMATPRSIWRPTPIRYGRTPPMPIPLWWQESKPCPTWCSPPRRTRRHQPHLMGCWCTCAPRRGTMRWPGWMRQASLLPNPNSPS
jgi:hypothetical protein